MDGGSCRAQQGALHTDSGSEFINHHLHRYCRQERIEFTRSRPNRKNDNNFTEQKNNDVVRRHVGYLRLQTVQEVALLNQLYDRLRLVLHVSPMNERGMDVRQSRVGALVLVLDPTSRLGIDPSQVGAILGLTPAESHVAVSLAQGKTIRDIALGTGRSPTTIRWHVKHMFAKHGLSRQVELVQLVMSLADVPPTR